MNDRKMASVHTIRQPQRLCITGDTLASMKEITVRELRNNGSVVINRVLLGESLLVTRDGAEVAELHPVHQRPTHMSVLRKKWQGLPSLDPVALRGDIDSIIDQSIS